jgi:hypothetical protein
VPQRKDLGGRRTRIFGIQRRRIVTMERNRCYGCNRRNRRLDGDPFDSLKGKKKVEHGRRGDTPIHVDSVVIRRQRFNLGCGFQVNVSDVDMGWPSAVVVI